MDSKITSKDVAELLEVSSLQVYKKSSQVKNDVRPPYMQFLWLAIIG